jgi:UDP-N-acetylglucosamine/UDP-N-acetylgalactosamine diphosphorylase
MKNASGDDSPDTAVGQIYASHARWLIEAGASIAPGVKVEISPLVSYSGEGLEVFKGVRFDRETFVDQRAP